MKKRTNPKTLTSLDGDFRPLSGGDQKPKSKTEGDVVLPGHHAGKTTNTSVPRMGRKAGSKCDTSKPRQLSGGMYHGGAKKGGGRRPKGRRFVQNANSGTGGKQKGRRDPVPVEANGNAGGAENAGERPEARRQERRPEIIHDVLPPGIRDLDRNSDVIYTAEQWEKRVKAYEKIDEAYDRFRRTEFDVNDLQIALPSSDYVMTHRSCPTVAESLDFPRFDQFGAPFCGCCAVLTAAGLSPDDIKGYIEGLRLFWRGEEYDEEHVMQTVGDSGFLTDLAAQHGYNLAVLNMNDPGELTADRITDVDLPWIVLRFEGPIRGGHYTIVRRPHAEVALEDLPDVDCLPEGIDISDLLFDVVKHHNEGIVGNADEYLAVTRGFLTYGEARNIHSMLFIAHLTIRMLRLIAYLFAVRVLGHWAGIEFVRLSGTREPSFWEWDHIRVDNPWLYVVALVAGFYWICFHGIKLNIEIWGTMAVTGPVLVQKDGRTRQDLIQRRMQHQGNDAYQEAVRAKRCVRFSGWCPFDLPLSDLPLGQASLCTVGMALPMIATEVLTSGRQRGEVVAQAMRWPTLNTNVVSHSYLATREILMSHSLQQWRPNEDPGRTYVQYSYSGKSAYLPNVGQIFGKYNGGRSAGVSRVLSVKHLKTKESKPVATAPIGVLKTSEGPIGGGLYPTPGCAYAALAACEGRAGAQPVSTNPTSGNRNAHADEVFARVAEIVLDELLPTVDLHGLQEPLTFDDRARLFRKLFRKKRGARWCDQVIARAYKRLHHGATKRDVRCGCFTKAESSAKRVKRRWRLRPRMIATMSEAQFWDLFPVLLIIERWNHGYFQNFQIKDMTPSDALKQVEKVLGHPLGIQGTDYSKFEASICHALRKSGEDRFMRTLLRMAGMDHTEQAYKKHMKRERKLYHKCFTFSNAGRCSGDFTTSWGNGLTNFLILTTINVLRGMPLGEVSLFVQQRCNAVLEGDDGIFGPIIDDISVYAGLLGLEMSAEESGYEPSEVSFLRNMWTPEGRVPDVARILSKMFWVKNGARLKRSKQLAVLRQMAMCIRAMYPNCPVLDAATWYVGLKTAGFTTFDCRQYVNTWKEEHLARANLKTKQVNEKLRTYVADPAPSFCPIPVDVQRHWENEFYSGRMPHLGMVLNGHDDVSSGVHSFDLVRSEGSYPPQDEGYSSEMTVLLNSLKSIMRAIDPASAGSAPRTTPGIYRGGARGSSHARVVAAEDPHEGRRVGRPDGGDPTLNSTERNQQETGVTESSCPTPTYGARPASSLRFNRLSNNNNQIPRPPGFPRAEWRGLSNRQRRGVINQLGRNNAIEGRGAYKVRSLVKGMRRLGLNKLTTRIRDVGIGAVDTAAARNGISGRGAYMGPGVSVAGRGEYTTGPLFEPHLEQMSPIPGSDTTVKCRVRIGQVRAPAYTGQPSRTIKSIVVNPADKIVSGALAAHAAGYSQYQLQSAIITAVPRTTSGSIANPTGVQMVGYMGFFSDPKKRAPATEDDYIAMGCAKFTLEDMATVGIECDPDGDGNGQANTGWNPCDDGHLDPTSTSNPRLYSPGVLFIALFGMQDFDQKPLFDLYLNAIVAFKERRNEIARFDYALTSSFGAAYSVASEDIPDGYWPSVIGSSYQPLASSDNSMGASVTLDESSVYGNRTLTVSMPDEFVGLLELRLDSTMTYNSIAQKPDFGATITLTPNSSSMTVCNYCRYINTSGQPTETWRDVNDLTITSGDIAPYAIFNGCMNTAQTAYDVAVSCVWTIFVETPVTGDNTLTLSTTTRAEDTHINPAVSCSWMLNLRTRTSQGYYPGAQLVDTYS